ncbi:MAG: recombinase family protein [Clostridia bacterium]|nr:recombinase family protein [Clostridia bacterium]
MDRIVQRVKFEAPKQERLLRVAAYSRVSNGKDTMLHSLSAQVSYYSNLIQNHEGWIYCGVYSDEALTGTKETREDFQRLIADCRAGKIDLVITKSISRFARNTVTLLNTVRELKLLGIGVFFEEQNINTLSAEGELMLTILASYAQEESLSASENVKWRIQNDFKQGKLPMSVWNIYGYKRTPDGGLEIIPEEAEIVKQIYKLYLDGLGVLKIAQILNEMGIESNTRDTWSAKKVRYILSNEKYIGDLLLQKSFRLDHLTKKTVRNRGEKTQYYVEDNHEPIIPREVFEAVQLELEKRREKHCKEVVPQKYAFTGKILCENCGKNFRRKVTATRVVWICSTFDRLGKKVCASKQIPDETLCAVSAEVLGIADFDADLFEEKIIKITVPEANHLIYHFKDGHTVETTWKDRSRSESWTPEMREQVRQNNLKRRNQEWQKQ